jgi:hypothetical protein
VQNIGVSEGIRISDLCVLTAALMDFGDSGLSNFYISCSYFHQEWTSTWSSNGNYSAEKFVMFDSDVSPHLLAIQTPS